MTSPGASSTPSPPPHPSWAALLPTGLEPDGLPGLAAAAVVAFGDSHQETRALLSGEAMVVPLVTRGALRLSGQDRIEFLQGQLSHDVRALRPGEARQALLLEHRGRPRAELVAVRRDQDVYLAVDDGRGEVVRRSLEDHVIFDQVVLQDLSTRLASFVVAGEAAVQALARVLNAAVPATAGAGVTQLAWRGSDVLLHVRPRGLRHSLDVHLLSERLPDLWQALLAEGVQPAGERALAAARVAAGIAAAAFEGVDALPQESGLEDRVSYRKGCYLGQEIMARVEARGNVRRSLARLALAAAPRQAELAVHAGGDRVVGRVGTVARAPDGAWRALAVLRNDLSEAVELGALGVPASIEVRLPAARRGDAG